MKTKLLKKVRKRFSITHMPHGYIDEYDGEHYNFNLFKLTDFDNGSWRQYVQLGYDSSQKEQYCKPNRIFNTSNECIDYLKWRIIQILREEGHRGRKDKTIKQQHTKVWYL